MTEARAAIDHRFLNEVQGLSVPTLENIAVWLWERLSPTLPGLSKVAVWRDSCGQRCIYAP